MKKIRFIPLLGLAYLFTGCNVFQQVDVMPVPPEPEEEHISNVYTLVINEGVENFEVWYSDSCIEVNNGESKGTIQLKWDKISGGCKWVGLGIGWDNWFGKDISSIVNNSAVQLKVRMIEGPGTNLPLAFCLEDYSGNQAWLGFSSNALRGEKKIIDTTWTNVVLPLSEFDWSEGADPYNMKQFIIQFEADGNVELDEIRFIPFDGSYRKRAMGMRLTTAPNIDGNLSEYSELEPSLSFNESDFYIGTSNDQLIFAGKVKDNSPFNNKRTRDNIWNGDAIEIAFSSDPGSLRERKRFRSTDHQIGLRISQDEPFIWHWKKKSPVENFKLKVRESPGGYSFECAIPAEEFGFEGFITDILYGLEIAIDDADASGNRKKQIRWNNPEQSEFHINPSLWGELIFRE